MRSSIVTSGLVVTALALATASGPAQATPSTVFWAPATPSLQGFGVVHVTYDTYFGAGAYPIDVGLTVGLLPPALTEALQLEVGFDLFYPTLADGEPMAVPIQLNAKLGTPEDSLFDGQPGLSFGVYGVGFEEDVTDADVLYVALGKTLPLGTLAIGGYYGLNPDLFQSPEGHARPLGLLASWSSPAIDFADGSVIDKINVVWDVQTGANVVGATGGGVSLYLTPAIVLLTGPVFFFEPDLQPGGASWLWSVQLDVDLDLTR